MTMLGKIAIYNLLLGDEKCRLALDQHFCQVARHTMSYCDRIIFFDNQMSLFVRVFVTFMIFESHNLAG